jgi:hypothetical protein
LKQSIEQSLHVTLYHSDGLFHTLADPSDARVTRNLRNLARVARNFHSSASSTASTIHGGNGTQWNVLSDTAMSVTGGLGLTIDKRHQLDRYFKSMRRATRRKPLVRNTSSAATSVRPLQQPAASTDDADSDVSEMGDDNDDGDDEAEIELLFLNGLEEVAKDSMLNQDFAKAETILVKAIQRHAGSSSAEVDFKKLQIQLALCYFFQHKWRLAEPLISKIAKSKTDLDTVVCNLLHALALAHLADYGFDSSITLCKQSLQGKKRLKRVLGDAHTTFYNGTLGLLATIYEIKGDHYEAEALRRNIPESFSYEHPLNEVEFIVKHSNLAEEVFGQKITLDWRPVRPLDRKLTSIAELPGPKLATLVEMEAQTSEQQHLNNPPRTFKPAAKKPLQTFRSRIDLYERFDRDTAKEVVLNSPTSSIPSSASESSDEFNVTSSAISNSGSSTFSRSEPILRRPFTQKIAHIFRTVRVRPRWSSDDLTISRSLQRDSTPSPVRRKLGKGLWSKSDANLFTLKKPRRRLLRKWKSYEDGEKAMIYEMPNGDWNNGNYAQRPASISRDKYRYGVYSWLGMSSDNHFHELPVNPAVRRYSLEDPVRSATSKNDQCVNNVEQPSIQGDKAEPSKYTNFRALLLNLKPLIIPDQVEKQGGTQLVAHYPQRSPNSSVPENKEAVDGQAMCSIVSGPSPLKILSPTLPPPPHNTHSSGKIMAKVLYDFTGEEENELAIRENEIIHIIRRASKGGQSIVNEVPN